MSVKSFDRPTGNRETTSAEGSEGCRQGGVRGVCLGSVGNTEGERSASLPNTADGVFGERIPHGCWSGCSVDHCAALALQGVVLCWVKE